VAEGVRDPLLLGDKGPDPLLHPLSILPPAGPVGPLACLHGHHDLHDWSPEEAAMLAWACARLRIPDDDLLARLGNWCARPLAGGRPDTRGVQQTKGSMVDIRAPIVHN